MAVPTLVELAESGAHFGHHRSMVFPKARDYVFTVKNNVALINLELTQAAIEQAQKTIAEAKKNGQMILFVGTKRSVRPVVKEVAESIGGAYITERWFGGMLTNFATMLENIKRMNELNEYLQGSDAARLSKKERLTLERRLHRYQRFLGGIATLKAMPDLIVLASASEDAIAVDEANQLDIPVIAITDTDMNPERITCPIPANDDAPKAVELIMHAMVEAPSTAKKEAPAKAEKEVEVVEKPAKATKVTKKATATKTKKETAKPAKKAAAKAKK